MNQTGIRHIAAFILLAVFLIKGMAGIVSFFSTSLNDQSLIELVSTSEQEENKSIPESKGEGEPNEYFITHTPGTPGLHISQFTKETISQAADDELPGYSSVATPPPDRA